MTAMEAAVSIQDLRVVRGGREVLHGVTLDIAKGSVTGLLGPSGCGKTTLMRTIVGVQHVTSGVVTVFGKPAGTSSLRRRVGYVTQAPSVYDDLTVAENLRYFGRVYGADGHRAAEVAGIVGLASHLGQSVGRLSGGQRARVSLATALLNKPDVLILDEPTVGLDPVLRRDLWEMFHGLARGGTTLLVSSHVMDEAERCDSLVLMRDGHVLAADTPEKLRERTRAADIEGAFLALIAGQEVDL